MGFAHVCRESNAAVGLVGVLVGVEVLALACVVGRWWVERREGGMGRGGEGTKLEEFA